jgi:hypothetical protein
MHLNNGKEIFREGITLVGLTLSMLMITLFGSITATIGAYFTRGGLCTAFCTILIIIYTIVFTMFVFDNDTPNPDTTKTSMELYTTILLPPILFCLTVASTILFGVKFCKHTVES